MFSFLLGTVDGFALGAPSIDVVLADGAGVVSVAGVVDGTLLSDDVSDDVGQRLGVEVDTFADGTNIDGVVVEAILLGAADGMLLGFDEVLVLLFPPTPLLVSVDLKFNINNGGFIDSLE